MTDSAARDKAWAEWRQRDLDIPAAMRGTARAGFNAGWDAAGREVADLLAGYVEELAEARAALAAVDALADEADTKGKYLQQIPEMKLVGNAYVGMSERIRAALARAQAGTEEA